MTKHIHTLIINKVGKNSKKYIYDFGLTKNVELTLSETGISITVQLTKEYDKEEMLSGDSYLFSDVIKKALLLYLLKYNKALNINSITIKTDDEQEEIPFPKGAKPPIYSMINGTLEREIPKAFSRDTVFQNLLNTPNSKYDKKLARRPPDKCSIKIKSTRLGAFYCFLNLCLLYFIYKNCLCGGFAL